jgi:hypothetical protein
MELAALIRLRADYEGPGQLIYGLENSL